MLDLRRSQYALAVAVLGIFLASLAASLPLVYAKEVAIEVDIDAQGNVTLDPNPTPVANGDTVRWHIRTGTFSRGIRVTIPAGADSPFGNKNSDLVSSIYPASTCSSFGLLGNPPVSWPSGVTGYKYRVETYIDNSSSVYKDVWFSKISVGGIAVPIDKFGLLAPYVGLTLTILATTVVAAVCVKRVERRKEKQ